MVTHIIQAVSSMLIFDLGEFFNMKLKAIIFILVFFCLFSIWTKLMKTDTSIFDGNNENSNMNYLGFKELPDNTLDYLILGSSNVYMDISPAVIWKNYNYAGYVYASPTQPIYISYLYLMNALKTQKPKIVFLDAFGIAHYEHAVYESYAHLGMDYLPLNYNKFKIIKQLPYEKEGFIFPFVLYHSRWEELSKNSDFKLLGYSPYEDFLGYTPAYIVQEASGSLLSEQNDICEIPTTVLSYVDKIYELCRLNDIQLVLFKTPVISWSLSESEAVGELANKMGIEYLELNKFMENYQIDLTRDFCDGGAHLNDQGSEKVSLYLGKYMSDSGYEKKERCENEEMYYEKRVEAQDNYKELYDLRQCSSLAEYINNMNMNEYVVLLQGNNGTEENNIIEYLNESFGFNCTQMGLKVVGLINDGKLVQNADALSAILQESISGVNFYIESNDDSSGKKSKIQVDYQNYSKESNFNIVVYSKKMKAVIDTFAVEDDELLSILR